jgi:hypothetical protein
MGASAVIADVRTALRGQPVFLAGSLVAEDTYAMSNAHSDVDLFCPTSQVLVAVTQQLLDAGYTLDDRFERVWVRWLRYGFKSWHTNSLRLSSPAGVETNLVYKLVDGHPTTSLAQVLESFDFGLLATGWDLESDTFRDMRSYLFPGYDINGPLPMMPSKRTNWRNGFISQYNGLRESGRYAKYHAYGYDLSLVKDDLVTGYDAAALYFSLHYDTEKQMLGRIYDAIARYIEDDDIDELHRAHKEVDYQDSLDAIMAALE